MSPPPSSSSSSASKADLPPQSICGGTTVDGKAAEAAGGGEGTKVHPIVLTAVVGTTVVGTTVVGTVDSVSPVHDSSSAGMVHGEDITDQQEQQEDCSTAGKNEQAENKIGNIDEELNDELDEELAQALEHILLVDERTRGELS